jgi:hypothetical protein
MGMEDALMVRKRLVHGGMEAVGRRSLVEAGHIPLEVEVEAVRVQTLAVEEAALRQLEVVGAAQQMLVVRLTVQPMLVVVELLPGSLRRRM